MSNPSFDVVALDLNGTALNTSHTLAEPTMNKIRELIDRGVRVIVATGRSSPAVYSHVRHLALPVELPCILYNGAVACSFPPNSKDPEAEMVDVFRDLMDAAISRKIIEFGTEEGHCVQYYVKDSIYVHTKTAVHERLCKRYSDLTGAVQIKTKDESLKEGTDECSTPEKILVMCENPDEVSKKLTEVLCAEGTPGVNIIKGGFFVEILNASKGSGLVKMCDVLGIDIGRVVAFGDGFNDIEFIRLAGLGIAMRNGREVIKLAADRVTEFTNEDLGVVRELEKLESEGLL